ncbi:MAG: hypothetical protein GXN99_01105 [Candidatus Nanohaloarchaeota archaeon]|nr:hypothetical protein [Candidatus Nanohaloarchaeota archaeon]
MSENTMILCSRCSLPTPSHHNSCVHCNTSLDKAKKSLAIKKFWKYYSIASFTLLVIIHLLPYAQDLHILKILLKINAVYIILFDLFIDPYFKKQSISRMPAYRLKNLAIYMISTYFIGLVKRKK